MSWCERKQLRLSIPKLGHQNTVGRVGEASRGKEYEFALEENTRKEILRYRHNNREGTRTVLNSSKRSCNTHLHVMSSA